jgi:tRNA dimethylallyltransferase
MLNMIISIVMSPKPSLVIISGPTCVGKTDVAISLARPLEAEIISADAMQVYRYMNIGTAKPTEDQRSQVRHHLIDVADPDESYNAALFKTMAEVVISDLHKKARPIFVVGGTGLYIKALTQGLFPAQEQDGAARKKLKKEAETIGLVAMYQRLHKVDPAAASRIHPNDSYRIIRALEVHQVTGQAISYHHGVHGFRDTPYTTIKIGLTQDRDVLYDRINRRVDQMLASGLLEEVKWLLDQGYSSTLKSMRSIGYRHMADYLEGRTPWDETMRLFKRDTRRYAKRQLTWFRADPGFMWVQPEQIDVMRNKIGSFLRG